MFTRSCSMSSAVVMTREFAWKPRSAVIMLVNVWARSTLDISTAPGLRVPAPPTPGMLSVLVPELAEGVHMLSPARSRPDALENVASTIRYGVVRVLVAGSTYDTPPDWSMATPVAPAGVWVGTWGVPPGVPLVKPHT